MQLVINRRFRSSEQETVQVGTTSYNNKSFQKNFLEKQNFLSTKIDALNDATFWTKGNNPFRLYWGHAFKYRVCLKKCAEKRWVSLGTKRVQQEFSCLPGISRMHLMKEDAKTVVLRLRFKRCATTRFVSSTFIWKYWRKKLLAKHDFVRVDPPTLPFSVSWLLCFYLVQLGLQILQWSFLFVKWSTMIPLNVFCELNFNKPKQLPSQERNKLMLYSCIFEVSW